MVGGDALVTYAIKDGYTQRDRPAYFLDDPKGVTFQPDVYWYAFGLAIEFGACRIVDVGCGYAPKLETLHAQRPDWDFLGIDHGLNIQWCETQHAWGQWLTIDLEHPHSYDATGSILICADVIEHLIDPGPLLDGIRRSGCTRAVLSTPERDLNWGANHNGPPPNPCHVREWNRDELGAHLTGAGLTVEHLGLTRSDDSATGEKTILARVAP